MEIMLRSAVHKTLVVILAIVALVETLGWAAVIADASGSGDRSVLVLAASMLGLLGGSALHVVIHELGHLFAALTLRLRVLGFRVWRMQFGAPGPRLGGTGGHVVVDARRGQAAVPARMVIFTAAGPLANVATAATTAMVAMTESVSLEVRLVAVGLTVAGFVAAIVNLVPHRLSSTTANDGLMLLRWIFRPGAEVARIGRLGLPTTMRPIAPPN
jgi:hypothetical protein